MMTQKFNIANNHPEKFKINLAGLAALLCGATNDIVFNVVGEFYLSELLVVLLALIFTLLKSSKGVSNTRVFWAFVLVGWITLLGYMLSDIYVGTEPAQYFKGWGRVIILMSDCVAIMILAIYNRQMLWWFMLGTGLGGIIFLYLTGVPFNVWKLGYGERFAMVFLTLLALLPKRSWPILLVGYGIFNIWLDYRNLGAAIIVVAAIIWAGAKRPDKRLISLIVYSVVALIAGLVTVNLTQDEFKVRRVDSNIGRSAAIIVSLHAISDSPFIGYGSWTINAKYAEELREKIEEKRKQVEYSDEFTHLYTGNSFQAHSQILQAWIEGGLLGAMFFIFYGYKLLQTALWCALRRRMDEYSPVFLFILIMGLWNLVASPFLGFERIQIAMAVGVIVAIAIERKRTEAVKTPSSNILDAASVESLSNLPLSDKNKNSLHYLK